MRQIAIRNATTDDLKQQMRTMQSQVTSLVQQNTQILSVNNQLRLEVQRNEEGMFSLSKHIGNSRYAAMSVKLEGYEMNQLVFILNN